MSVHRLRSRLPIWLLLVAASSTCSTHSAEPTSIKSPSSGAIAPPLRERFAPTVAKIDETPDFRRHVIPLFSRLGCNGRSCHGSFQGQGGFRMSMFGYDFVADHAALLDSKPPRVDRKSPGESLMLRKPTSDDDHGGGKRFEPNGWEYRVLRTWIERGAPRAAADGPQLEHLIVTPDELLFSSTATSAQLRVVAHWSDGSREDVTAITRYSSNDDGMAKVDGDGAVTSLGPGGTHVIACYDSAVVAVPVLRPVSDRIGPKYPAVPTPTPIDELIVAKLKKLGIVPSPVCSDTEFLRRASLDVCGTLPTPAEVEAFLADDSSDKRSRKIDELLARPEYSAWWATLFCDLTGLNAASELGGTDYAVPIGNQWYEWVERKFRENVGYHDIARGIILAVSRKPGQSYDDYVAEQVSYQRKNDRVDFAAQPWMPHFWSRANLTTTDEKALAFAHVFMGVRLDCAQCHKHPFDRWSQQDFKDFAAFFERVDKRNHPDVAEDRKRLEEKLGVPNLKTAAERRGAFLRWAAAGEPAPFFEVSILPLPKTGKNGKPLPPPKLRILGGETVTLADDQDPREPIMQWLLAKDNPYFAPAFINRVWHQYFGVGIVSPVDDFNLGNPPSNRELLDELTRDFIEHDFDVRRLHRRILSSDAYQRSCRTNETNRNDDRLFSVGRVRRLPAEVAADAMRQATADLRPPKAAPKRSINVLRTPSPAVPDRFIAEQVPAYERRFDYSLLVFGKPIRKTNCDCERQNDPSLLQAVYLRNDADMTALFGRTDGWLKNLPKEGEPAKLVDEAYLRTVSRRPTADERDRCLRHFAETPDRTAAMEDLLWSLLNTAEFITNH